MTQTNSSRINLPGQGYGYRTTVAPWFGGLSRFAPQTNAITGAPLIDQRHATPGTGGRDWRKIDVPS